MFATVGLLQDREVALLDTAGRVARHQQDRQARTQHPRLSGELEPTTGFMMGKFKVSGDMSVALKLQRIV